MKKISIFIFLTLIGLSSKAQELARPVMQEYAIGIGSSEALSTYLSPLRYSGKCFSLSGNWDKSSQWSPENLVMNFNSIVNYREMHNPQYTAQMLGIDAGFSWGLAWRKRLPASLQVTAGGAVRINGGALYLTRNGNNPVTVLASAGIDAAASISWHGKIKRLPVLVSNRLTLPTLGTFFCPEYGETYYEIWLGNHAGLFHCGWWGNNFGIDNLLSVKLDFGRTAMEVGYRYSRQSYWANHISTAIDTHQFVIGVIPHGLGLKRNKKANYALY